MKMTRIKLPELCMYKVSSYVYFLKLVIILHTVSVQRRHFGSSDNSCCLLSSQSWTHFSLPTLYPRNETFQVDLVYIKLLLSQTTERDLFRSFYSKFDNVHVFFIVAIESASLIREIKNEFDKFKDLIVVKVREDFVNINSKAWVSIKHAEIIRKIKNVEIRCVALSNDDALIHERPLKAINCSPTEAALFGEKISDVPASRKGAM